MSSPLIRSALVVRDLDRSRRFYEEVLGLTSIYLEADLTDTITWKLFNSAEHERVRCVILKPPHIDGRSAPNFGMIGLFEVSDQSIGSTDRRTDGIRLGETILVFYIDDMQRCLNAVEKLGGSITTGPEVFRLPKVRAIEAIVRDPDGVAINLVEAPESRAW